MSEIVIQAGTDPRSRDEFASIRQEINNMNHPARLEVNWGVIEQLSLLLFKNHGVDLQTAAYYTLARTKKHSLAGFTEGIELIAGLVSNQWDVLWPEQLQVRSDILEWMNQKVSSLLRADNYNAEDLRLIYRSERALELLINKLQQQPIKKLAKLENILYLLQNHAKRIEQGLSKTDIATNELAQQGTQLIYAPNVIRTEETVKAFEPAIETNIYPPTKPVKIENKHSKFSLGLSFGSGAVFASLLFCAVLFYQNYTKQPSQLLDKQFKQNVLNVEDAKSLRSEYGVAKITELSNNYMPLYENELSKVLAAAPLAELTYGQSLIDNANVFWPTLPIQEKLQQNWYESLELQSNQAKQSIEKLAKARAVLEQFKSEAGALKLQKGKYMTLGYIEEHMQKIEVLLNQQSQIESLLYELEQLENKKTDPKAVRLKKQIDEKFNQLLIHYFLLTNTSRID